MRDQKVFAGGTDWGPGFWRRLSIIGVMDSYNVAEAKTHLSDILAQVAAGEEVLLTKRGKPIARVVPIARTASVLGAGVDDANINHDVLTEDAWRKALSDDEAAGWYE